MRNNTQKNKTQGEKNRQNNGYLLVEIIIIHAISSHYIKTAELKPGEPK